jgi:D-lactate dehydrogenase
LDMNVFGVDIVERHKSVEYVSPEDGAKRGDIIICAMNLTDENHDYFSEDFFKNVKENLIFINISRGEISPSTILLNVLQKRKVAGVALDVYKNEKSLSVGLRSGKVDNDDELLAVKKMMQMENVILTPHNAFNTFESVERKSEQTIQQLIFFLKNNTFKWYV